jgi:hypothetical protein
MTPTDGMRPVLVGEVRRSIVPPTNDGPCEASLAVSKELTIESRICGVTT